MRKVYLVKVFVASLFSLMLVLMCSHFSFASGRDGRDIGGCTTSIIETTLGPVCGGTVETSTGSKANAFLGIPYGADTSGENRFTAPKIHEKWSDLFEAINYGSPCPEPETAGAGMSSEDCLHMNVWTPENVKDGDDIAVMLFIYGGDFVIGNSENTLYDGSYLAANKDVIVVSFNYRVGAFGFLVTNELDGNYGFLDQQLAMKWTKDNIKKFGGDPDRITIFGQSAGAASLGIHLTAAPDSEGLFHAGIMESNVLGTPLKTQEQARDFGEVFEALLDCKDVECLRSLSKEQITTKELFMEGAKTAVFPGWPYYISWNPVVDGTIIIEDPTIAFEKGRDHKPIIMGTNRDEGELFEGLQRVLDGGDSDEVFGFTQYIEFIASTFGRHFQDVEREYPGILEGSNETVISEIITDYSFHCGTHDAMVANSGHVPIWAYRFNKVPSFNFLCLDECSEFVCHMAELPFVFHSAELLTHFCKPFLPRVGYEYTAEEERMSQEMMDYWTNFAKYFDPNGKGEDKTNFTWTNFTTETPDYIVFDENPLQMEFHPFEEKCVFWDKIGYHLLNPWEVDDVPEDNENVQ